MLLSDWLSHCTQSAVSVQWLEVVHKMGMFFSFFQRFVSNVSNVLMQMDNTIKFLRRLNEGHLQFLDIKKGWNYWKKKWCAKFNNNSLIMSRNNWKPLFEVNFSKNSTKTTRLFALDFHEVIVDSAFSLINYHLIEISSS